MRRLYSVASIGLLLGSLLRGCPAPIPSRPNDGAIACTQWSKERGVVRLYDARGCFALVRRPVAGDPGRYRVVLGIADRAVNGRSYCVRVTYPSLYAGGVDYPEQICVGDGTYRTQIARNNRTPKAWAVVQG